MHLSRPPALHPKKDIDRDVVVPSDLSQPTSCDVKANCALITDCSALSPAIFRAISIGNDLHTRAVFAVLCARDSAGEQSSRQGDRIRSHTMLACQARDRL